MERLAARYPDDTEAAIFYALTLLSTAQPTDKTYANQLKAAAILEKIFVQQPRHPGVAHYLIHSYDYPPLLPKASQPHAAMPGLCRRCRMPCTCHHTFLPGWDYGRSQLPRTALRPWLRKMNCAPRQQRVLVRQCPACHGLHDVWAFATGAGSGGQTACR